MMPANWAKRQGSVSQSGSATGSSLTESSVSASTPPATTPTTTSAAPSLSQSSTSPSTSQSISTVSNTASASTASSMSSSDSTTSIPSTSATPTSSAQPTTSTSSPPPASTSSEPSTSSSIVSSANDSVSAPSSSLDSTTSTPPTITSTPTTTPSSTPPTTTSQPPTTTSDPPTTTSEPPTITSNPPTTNPPTTQQPTTTTVTTIEPTFTNEATTQERTDPATTTFTTTAPPDTTSSNPPSQVVVVSSATTTLQSTVIFTTTDSQGHTTTTIPPTFTETVVSTNSAGQPITVTQVVANPTLSTDDNSVHANGFFKEKGAVAGVFLIVGLAATSICLFIFFLVRRRRRTRKLDHDAAVLAAAGFNRAPIDDEDEKSPRSRTLGSDVELSRYSGGGYGTASSLPSATRPPSGYMEDPSTGPSEHDGTMFDPYAAYVAEGPGAYRSRAYSPPGTIGGGEGHRPGHSASFSAGSTEPLLGTMHRTPSGGPFDDFRASTPPPPPRNPQRVVDRLRKDSLGGEEPYRDEPERDSWASGQSDERLNPVMHDRLKSAGSIKDSEDYSRPVLEVRNVPDDADNK